MGRRLKALSIAAAILSLTGGALAMFGLSPGPANGHRPGHINCPPGSHVTPSNLTYGKELEAARAKNVEVRRMTAGHPASQP